MAKKKIYNGKIYFNYNGNMEHDSPHLYDQRKNLEAKDIDCDHVLTGVWDSNTKQYVQRRSIYTLAELNVGDVEPTRYKTTGTYVCSVDRYYMIDNYIFDDELQYTGYSRGQSSVGLDFTSTKDGKHYNVFLTDFEQIVKHMVNGHIKGQFTFTKRGTKFGVKLV